jgi:hypothetical protein
MLCNAPAPWRGDNSPPVRWLHYGVRSCCHVDMWFLLLLRLPRVCMIPEFSPAGEVWEQGRNALAVACLAAPCSTLFKAAGLVSMCTLATATSPGRPK